MHAPATTLAVNRDPIEALKTSFGRLETLRGRTFKHNGHVLRFWPSVSIDGINVPAENAVLFLAMMATDSERVSWTTPEERPDFPGDYPEEFARKKVPLPPADRDSFVIRMEQLGTHVESLRNLLNEHDGDIPGNLESVPRHRVMERFEAASERLWWMGEFLKVSDAAAAR